MKDIPISKEENRGELAKELARKTFAYTGADIENLCREAAMITLRNDIHAQFVPKDSFFTSLDSKL